VESVPEDLGRICRESVSPHSICPVDFDCFVRLFVWRLNVGFDGSMGRDR
jgi:hypothetical protein